jgi:protein TonB
MMDPRNRVLLWALGISIGAHAALLALNFAAPDTFRRLTGISPLEVVLVNSRHANAPKTPQALAQANLDGGGNNEQGLARSPLPDSGVIQDGTNLDQVLQQKVTELEAEQARLLAEQRSLRATRSAVADEVKNANEVARQPTPDEAALSRAVASIEKRVEDYNKRPRKKFITPSTQEVVYAQYYTEWRDKIERIGTANYPTQARGKLYGEVIVTVSIWADGTIESIDVRPSGQPILDRAAARVLKLAAPFKGFSAEMKAQYQIFVITTRFVFTKGELEARSVDAGTETPAVKP